MPQSKNSTDKNSSKIRNFLTKIFIKKDKRNALDNLGEYNYSLSQQLATSHKIISNLFAQYGIFLIKKNHVAPTFQEEAIFSAKNIFPENAVTSLAFANKK